MHLGLGTNLTEVRLHQDTLHHFATVNFFSKRRNPANCLMAKMMLVKTECKQAKNKLKYKVPSTAVLSSAFTMSACLEFLLWSPMQ